MVKKTKKRRVEIRGVTKCSEEYGVTHLIVRNSTKHARRTKPCEQCPWRKDVPTGVFPAEAYRTSAPTAYDAAMSTFSCHMSGLDSATCAGFLMRHATHNIAVRISESEGRLNVDEVTDGGYPLYETYREMAIANGVDPKDPVLFPVRGNDEPFNRPDYPLCNHATDHGDGTISFCLNAKGHEGRHSPGEDS